MNFQINKLANHNIYHAKFNSQYDITSTLVRIQEFYESPFPNIKGQVFTLDQFMDEYSRDKGRFTYFTDWVGFNIPSHVIENFFELYKYQLRYKEQQLLNKINWLFDSKYSTVDYRWYLIATYDEDKDNDITLDHEIAHGLWYLNPIYRNEMLENIDNLPSKMIDTLSESLLEEGYDNIVLDDEAQAYLATSTIYELKNDYNTDVTEEDVKPFRETFEKFNGV